MDAAAIPAVVPRNWHRRLLTIWHEDGPCGALRIAVAARQIAAGLALHRGVVPLAVHVEARGALLRDGERAEVLLILPFVHGQLHVLGRQGRDDVVIAPEHIQDVLLPTEGAEREALAPGEDGASIHARRPAAEAPVASILGPGTVVALAALVPGIQIRHDLVTVDGDVQDLLIDLMESLQVLGVQDVAVVEVNIVAGHREKVEAGVARIGLGDVVVVVEGHSPSRDPLLLWARFVREEHEARAARNHKDHAAHKALHRVGANNSAHLLEEVLQHALDDRHAC